MDTRLGRTLSDITTILRAASFAAHKHRNQRRKDADASPYINHPLALARVLADQLRGTDAQLERVFDETYRTRP
jgi:(p)ppGpp synthase/HD superfamily hydrolase